MRPSRKPFTEFQNAGKQPTRNVQTPGYEAVAEFIASRITRDKAGYAVHISDKGLVYLTRKDRQRANELPEQWKLGEYPYTGLRVEFIEEDLLDWQRSLAEPSRGRSPHHG